MPNLFEGLSQGFQTGRELGHQRAILAENARQFDETHELKEGYLQLDKDKFGFEKEKFNKTFDFTKEQYYTGRADKAMAAAQEARKQAMLGQMYKEGGSDRVINGLFEMGDAEGAIALQEKLQGYDNKVLDGAGKVTSNAREQIKLADDITASLAPIGMALKNPNSDKNKVYKQSLSYIKMLPGFENAPKELTPEMENHLEAALDRQMTTTRLKAAADTSVQAQSTIGKLQNDREARASALQAQGIDPSTDQAIQAMDAEINKNLLDYKKAEEELASAKSAEKRAELEKATGSSAQQFRNTYVRQVTPTVEAVTAYNKLADLFSRLPKGEDARLGPTDVAIVYSFVKGLDPGGRITDRETGMMQASAPIYEFATNFYNEAVTGAKFTAATRKSFLDASSVMLEAQLKEAKKLTQAAEKGAELAGFNKEFAVPDIVPDISDLKEPSVPPEAVNFYRQQDPTLTDAEIQELFKRDQGY